MSTFEIHFRTTAGTLFEPWLNTVYGSFQGVDFEGRTVEQELFLMHAVGTPLVASEASTRGVVSGALAQGTYPIEPHHFAISPSGTVSESVLPPFTLTVGCRQHLVLDTQVQVMLTGGLPPCTTAGVVELEGQVHADRDVQRVTIAVNGGAEATVCEPCGASPALIMQAAIPEGDSAVRVRAIDVAGVEASVTAYTSTVREPSADGVAPLRVTRRRAGLLVTWEHVPGAFGHVHAGSLAALRAGRYDHAPVACAVPGGAAEVAMSSTDEYYLVAGACAGGQSPLGRDSFGREIPPGTGCP
jgi:hypothetical protein